MVTGRDIVDTAMQWQGLPYRLGAEARVHVGGRGAPSALDCSELVELACRLNDVPMPDGTVNQFPWCQRAGTLVPVERAIATPGALLFVWRGPHAGGGAGNHVAISRGDGTTIEARSTRHGVGVFPAAGRGWTHGALIPGVDYDAPPPPPDSSISPIPSMLEELLMATTSFQLVGTDGTVRLYVPGQRSISLGGLPDPHQRLAHNNIAPLVGPPIPVDQHEQFAQRWDASVG